MTPLGWSVSVLAALAAFWVARAVYRHATAADLRGQVVLITGSSRGLGLVLARQLARAGCRVVICSRDGVALARAAEELGRLSPHVLALTCDLTKPREITRLVNVIRERFGGVDILFNNAGVIQVGPYQNLTVDDFDEAMCVHFWAPLQLVMEIVPEMKNRGRGRIVNISSVGGRISVPHLLAYNASKFALSGLSQGLRAELSRDGITVTTVYPGLMRTGSPLQAEFKGQHRKEYAWFSIADSLPLVTMSAERAARRIIMACRCGDAELILTWPAAVGIRLAALFPNTVTWTLSRINRWLPGPGGIGTQRAKGYQSQSRWSPSALTGLTDRAARNNNERPNGKLGSRHRPVHRFRRRPNGLSGPDPQ